MTFPIKFLSKEYVREQILNQYNGKNVRELARNYGYSERWIREILSKSQVG